MARYGIIDLEKLKATEDSISNPKDSLRFSVGLNKYIKPYILSPEETEAKWKEVYFEGAYQGQGIDEWDNFKQTL